MRSSTGYLVAVAVLVAAVGVAVLLVSLAPAPETREPPSRIPYVNTARVVEGEGPVPVHGAGTVRPSAEVDIAPQVGGRVVWVDPGFSSGRPVDAGQTLFRLEEADYEYRVREAQASLAARQVALLEAREDAAIARVEYERYAERRREEGSPDPNPLTLRVPQLKAAEAAVLREQAIVAQAKLDLSRTRVTAPFDGMVRGETVGVGQLVTPGQAVGRLYASDAVEVVVPLADADVALIPGLWETGPDRRRIVARVIARFGDVAYAWRGYVDRANAALDVETRTVDVIVRVPEPFAGGVPVVPGRGGDTSPPLLVGKFAEVAIEGPVPPSYFRIRRAALQAGNEVWTVRDGATVHVVPVRILQRIDDEIYVTGELQDGEPIVIGGIRFATDGMRVRTGEAVGQ